MDPGAARWPPAVFAFDLAADRNAGLEAARRQPILLRMKTESPADIEADLHPCTLAARGGGVEPQYGGLVPPIHPAVTYERAADGDYPRGVAYGRDQNPTGRPTERLLAQLEGGVEALLFGSGMAAAAALIDALPHGSRIVAPDRMYWALRRWLDQATGERRIAAVAVPAGDLEALSLALASPTSLVWLETPANPTCEITDISEACRLAHRAGAVVAVDNTLATPVLTQPLRLGADLVLHSATKALNGHSDVVAGALVTARRDELWERIAAARSFRGGILGPFEAWLLLRGLRTLFLRVARSSDSALALALRMLRDPAVTAVFYPGLESHPGHDIACRQMAGGFGGVLSFRVRGGQAAAMAVAARLRVIVRATSLGGVESLIEHRASIEGVGTPVPDDLLRLSVGIEDLEDLWADLDRALAPTRSG